MLEGEQFEVALIDLVGKQVSVAMLSKQPKWTDVILYEGKVYTYAYSVQNSGWCYQEATSVQWDDLTRN